MMCPCCGKEACRTAWSERAWYCVPCDLEWDWSEDRGVIGYWSLRELALSMESGVLTNSSVKIPIGTLPVFGIGERAEE